MLDTLTSLLEEQIKDLYNAENQLVKALPKMAKAASTDSLREAFESHLDETRGHVERLERVAALLEIKPSGKKCKAMQGLVEEGGEVLEEDGDGQVIDAALIAAAQRVEHYEIAAYGTCCAIAEQLGKRDIVQILRETLEEEKAADKKLTSISEEELLPNAPQNEGDEGEEEDESSNGRISARKAKKAGARPGR